MSNAQTNGMAAKTTVKATLVTNGKAHGDRHCVPGVTVGSARLAAWLEMTGETIAELAVRFGTVPGNLANWRNGHTRPGGPARALIENITGISAMAWDEALVLSATPPTKTTAASPVSRSEFDALAEKVDAIHALVVELHRGLAGYFDTDKQAPK